MNSRRFSAEQEPPIWEYYRNADFDPEMFEWPPLIEVFREWYRRNAGIAMLLKSADSAIRRAEFDYSEESMETLRLSLNTAAHTIRRSFSDFDKLLAWAIRTWESDPVIVASGGQNDSPKKAEQLAAECKVCSLSIERGAS